jgi:hypothetical protein
MNRLRLAIAQHSFMMGCMSVEEIESAISKLSANGLASFAKWFEEFAADQWDCQIEADIHAGRLEAAGKRADEQFEAGNCTPL